MCIKQRKRGKQRFINTDGNFPFANIYLYMRMYAPLKHVIFTSNLSK